jgi:hypothetical protein
VARAPARAAPPAHRRLTMHNELAYLSWTAFQRMAPAIVRLEVDRVDALLRDAGGDDALCEALARARGALECFTAGLAHARPRTVETACAPHLRAALVVLSLEASAREGPEAGTLRYIVDRLRYVHDRMDFIY